MKHFFTSIILIFLILTVFNGDLFSQEVSNKKYVFEMTLGPRFPIGVTRDDITTGLGLTAGVGYKLTDYFELGHLAIDFGSSSPHNPNSIVIQDYYSYYGRLAMETVTIFGFPLTTRLHFNFNKMWFGTVGAGVAYYWFSSKLEDPIYGRLQKSRSRNGWGPYFEFAVITNFFSEKWLIMFKGDFSVLDTHGKNLSIKEDVDPDVKVDRSDKYLTISLGFRYLF